MNSLSTSTNNFMSSAYNLLKYKDTTFNFTLRTEYNYLVYSMHQAIKDGNFGKIRRVTEGYTFNWAEWAGNRLLDPLSWSVFKQENASNKFTKLIYRIIAAASTIPALFGFALKKIGESLNKKNNDYQAARSAYIDIFNNVAARNRFHAKVDIATNKFLIKESLSDKFSESFKGFHKILNDYCTNLMVSEMGITKADSRMIQRIVLKNQKQPWYIMGDPNQKAYDYLTNVNSTWSALCNLAMNSRYEYASQKKSGKSMLR